MPLVSFSSQINDDLAPIADLEAESTFLPHYLSPHTS